MYSVSGLPFATIATSKPGRFLTIAILVELYGRTGLGGDRIDMM